MFAKFPAKEKWVVISDMLELGNEEKEEHEKLAELLNKLAFEKVILVGSRIAKYTLTSLRAQVKQSPTGSPRHFVPRDDVVGFKTSRQARDYLLETIKGDEAILFKGSQSMFLEGIIESLLADKKDGSKLPRRGDFWEKKRAKAGL
jgi:UDP-N-acetylmuramoyl-tripeptide--D-alanyl-D-alanine ligase